MYSEVYEILKKWKEECGARDEARYKISHSESKLTIYTSYPGYYIGKAGSYIYKYIEILKNTTGYIKTVEIIEVDDEYI